MITITLADGKQLTDLKMNGNNYVSNEVLDSSIFKNNLHRVFIKESTEMPDGTVAIDASQYENLSLDFFSIEDGMTYFVLNPVSSLVMEIAKIRSNIDYLAMMTGNDISD